MNDPYNEGYEAFSKGLSPDDNPYREQPEDKKKWDEGWEDGKIRWATQTTDHLRGPAVAHGASKPASPLMEPG